MDSDIFKTEYMAKGEPYYECGDCHNYNPLENFPHRGVCENKYKESCNGELYLKLLNGKNKACNNFVRKF